MDCKNISLLTLNLDQSLTRMQNCGHISIYGIYLVVFNLCSWRWYYYWSVVNFRGILVL